MITKEIQTQWSFNFKVLSNSCDSRHDPPLNEKPRKTNLCVCYCLHLVLSHTFITLSNTQKKSENCRLSNKKMTQLYFIYLYCDIIVLVLGIIGNVLVIMSILRQKKLLKNNYYVLVLQLAINDLAVLIIYLLQDISEVTLEKSLYDQFLAYRLYYFIYFLF